MQTPIVDPNTGKVTRTGQLLLEQLQAPSVTQGTSGGRPDASSVPDGALYVESDRSVVYYNYQGIWHYLAGAMWGTLNPDLRPTDLGVNDAGFDFRGTDEPREFIWSQTEWIETTRVYYGAHAERPDTAGLADGSLYVENDRGGVIYQAQSNVWHYLAGTMWGTLSPDSRPTDLGANDAGFTYRGTDQQRTFVWSGTVWVETTPVGNAASLVHPNVVTKVGATPGQIVEGGITDQSAGDSNTIFISSTGLVGIGTTTPGHVLDVSSAPATALRIGNKSATSNNTQFRFFGANANAETWALGTDLLAANGSKDLHFYSLSLNAAVFTLGQTSGHVGVSNGAPAFALDVTGDVNCSGLHRTAGVAGVSATITTAKLTTTGANGSLTFSGGILTGFVQPT
jgi:hypothetical protein